MQTVQLAMADSVHQEALREALLRSGPWRVQCVDSPRTSETCVLVMDEASLSRLPLPLPYPERVVLVTRKDPDHLSFAWEAGIVSLISPDDPPGTIILAIMAAALRVPKTNAAAPTGAISPNKPPVTAPISPEPLLAGAKRLKSE
jgi:hypothetical protein